MAVSRDPHSILTQSIRFLGDDKLTMTLKMLRVGKGLSQTELGKEIGVSQTTISAWEQGLSKPSSRNIYALAQLYAIDPSVIFDALFKQKS
uniref:Repressor protein CI n=2 Tax=root TaxID=1 RepID=A0A8S5S7K6_9CAUD|nr:MAG TPA: Repressor protein CI [Siphoviridae sp. ctj0M16]